MDAGFLRGLFTLFMFLAFIGIVIWAWSSRRKQEFSAAAQLPLEDDTGTIPDSGTSATTQPGSKSQ